MLKDKLSYLNPLVNFFLIGLAIMTIGRLAIFLLHFDRALQVEDWWMIFPLGLRLDLILLCYLSFLPAVIITFIPKAAEKVTSKFLAVYFSVFLFLIFLTEVLTPEFVDQYDTRPNKLFLEYLIYPKEIATMLVKSRLWMMAIIFPVLGLIIWGMVKLSPKLFKATASQWKVRLLIFPLLGFLLFWGARGSLTSRRPLNASNSVFSNDQLVNIMGVNSLYTVAFAAYSLKNEIEPSKLYGGMEEEESYRRVKKYMNVAEDGFTDPDNPLLHLQKPDSVLQRPYNLVIFLQESLGAEYVGALGGMPLTPNLDKLSQEGILFTNLYCTGTRSVRGIEAVSTGFLPSPSESVVKLSNSQHGFFTLAELLRQEGYATSFIYGGMANFDNMGSFFSGNGFKDIIDETVMDADNNQYALKGTWGYSDEDLVVKANEYFKSQGDKPFFSLMFSSSNHEPFEFPEGRIELYEQPQGTVHNAMKYADYAIGKFFELAKQEEYFKNTVFVVIADHNTRTYGQHLVPINKFHIPAVILAPNAKAGMQYGKLASQIDIPPTLLSMMGIEVEIPMAGRNLMTLPDSIAGRSIMQFHDINAFRVENQVVIMQPNKEPVQFELKSDTEMIPVEVDEELAKDALAHVLAAHYLYKGRKYKVKEKE